MNSLSLPQSARETQIPAPAATCGHAGDGAYRREATAGTMGARPGSSTPAGLRLSERAGHQAGDPALARPAQDGTPPGVVSGAAPRIPHPQDCQPEPSGGGTRRLLDTRGTTGHNSTTGRNGTTPNPGFLAFKDKLRRTEKRASMAAVTKDLYSKVARAVVEAGAWGIVGQRVLTAGREPIARAQGAFDGTWVSPQFDATSEAPKTVDAFERPDYQEQLLDWATRMEGCGKEAIVRGRDDCGHTELVLECCDVPPCPTRQAKRSREWDERSEACFDWFERLREHPEPRSAEWCERARAVQKRAKGKHHERLRRRIDAALYAAQFAEHKGLRWAHFEIGVQGHGLTRGEHYSKTLDTRASFMRYLRRNYNSLAAYVALDLGTEKQSPHFHAVVLCDFAPRDVVQRWLRSTDCTVPGCSHEADDRCDECRRAKRRCHHKHADGKPRCNGSWYVHAEQIGAKCPECGRRVGAANCHGTTFKTRVRAGFREVLKYAAAPVEIDNPPKPGQAFNDKQLGHAENVLRFYLVTRHRHRIESYGAAKLDLVELGLVEPRPEQKHGCCPCGNPWTWEVHGWRRAGAGYEWGCMLPVQPDAPVRVTGPPEPGGPVWVQESFEGFA